MTSLTTEGRSSLLFRTKTSGGSSSSSCRAFSPFSAAPALPLLTWLFFRVALLQLLQI